MIDPNKKYRTRDGREVRIYATDGAPSVEVHGAYVNAKGEWQPASWGSDGSMSPGWPGRDLIEVKPEVTERYFVGQHPHFGLSFTKDATAETVHGGIWKTIGAIDITNNGEKIIKVEIVNDYAPGAMR